MRKLILPAILIVLLGIGEMNAQGKFGLGIYFRSITTFVSGKRIFRNYRTPQTAKRQIII